MKIYIVVRTDWVSSDNLAAFRNQEKAEDYLNFVEELYKKTKDDYAVYIQDLDLKD